MSPKIAVESVALEYADPRVGQQALLALDNTSFSVAENEFLSILGPSGCGKTSLLLIVAGLIKPTRGRVLVGGQVVAGPGQDRGMVFQDYALLPWRTARDNIGMGLKIRGVPKDEQRRVAESYVNMFGLGGFADKYPHELSGGMRQRVAVARTLANSPQVILMDEPFAAVDAQTRAVLGEEFAAITASRLMTVMLVTHSVEEAVFLGDRVLIMSPRPGRVDSMLEVPLKRSERNWDSVRENSTFIQLTREASQIIRSFDVGLRRQ